MWSSSVSMTKTLCGDSERKIFHLSFSFLFQPYYRCSWMFYCQEALNVSSGNSLFFISRLHWVCKLSTTTFSLDSRAGAPTPAQQFYISCANIYLCIVFFNSFPPIQICPLVLYKFVNCLPASAGFPPCPLFWAWPIPALHSLWGFPATSHQVLSRSRPRKALSCFYPVIPHFVLSLLFLITSSLPY